MSVDFTDLFAGVRVRQIADARAWYARLLESEPAFFPNDVEAVWSVGEHCWLYVHQDAAKAGRELVTLMAADLDATAEAIGGRGIEPTGLKTTATRASTSSMTPTSTRSASARSRKGLAPDGPAEPSAWGRVRGRPQCRARPLTHDR